VKFVEHDRALGAAIAASNGPALTILIAIGLLVVVGAVMGLRVLNRTKRQLEATETLLYSDELTGVGNRRRLDRDLAVEAASPDTPVAVIKIDVDQFTRINDAHGRDAGDVVLRQLADVIRAQVRTGDVVYRYDGDEFCVLLAKATSGEAGLVAERVRAAVAELEVDLDDPLTVSVGVALGRSEHVNQTMDRAHAAMARSKDLGCDRVTLAAQPLLGPLAVTQMLPVTPATFG
jgi:diguanylate cyclase (GGDEF)-like protein